MQDNGNVNEKKVDLTFCTWNVKGVNEPVKRGKVLSHLKSLKADIMFLQETHLKNAAHNKLRCRWINQVYYSTFSAKTRGVAIVIKNDIPFRHTSTIADKNGRYVLVTGELHAIPIILLNIYGPNHDDPEFYRKVFSLIPDIPNGNLIIGGDFNLVLDPYLDKFLSKKTTLCKGSSFNKTYMDNMNICDVWRTLNPSGREYSFHSSAHNVYSRIYYFLLPLVRNVTYHNIIISDHCPVTCSFALGNFTKVHRSWRLDPQLLNDSKFQQYTNS